MGQLDYSLEVNRVKSQIIYINFILFKNLNM